MHEDLDGKVFTLDNLPIVSHDGRRGLPGSEPNCRCFMVPQLSWGEDD
jgi:hypothetical protein